jgi:hypothetical protein
VLRISGRLKLVYDAAAEAMTSQATALTATVRGGHDRCFCRLAGA